MKKILFLIHDLGQGGAEKVLVNLVNNMDPSEFDITVMSLFGGGVNEQFLKPHIHYRAVFKTMIRGNSHIMKLFSPKTLHRWFVKEKYDIEVSYLEGPSARVISGCPHKDTKLVSWIHVEQHTMKAVAASFRNEEEAVACYRRFDRTVCVSEYVKNDFSSIVPLDNPITVLYNTVESTQISGLASEAITPMFEENRYNLIAVGTLKPSKGYMRLLSVIKRLKGENYAVRLYILGVGPLQKEMECYIQEQNLQDEVVLLGYETNPYKYVSKADCMVCASFSEGFSTAVTEALIVGTTMCTVEVSGMKELLGEHNEYGIVTENSEEALFQGIRALLDDPSLLAYYTAKATERGKDFDTAKTVKAVEEMLGGLV